MKRATINKYRSVFFQLCLFGKWTPMAGNNEYYVLKQESKTLYDCEKEELKRVPTCFLHVYKKGTYKTNNAISLYDIEVLESNDFKNESTN